MQSQQVVNRAAKWTASTLEKELERILTDDPEKIWDANALVAELEHRGLMIEYHPGQRPIASRCLQYVVSRLNFKVWLAKSVSGWQFCISGGKHDPDTDELSH